MIIKEPKHGEHIGTSHFVDAKMGDIFVLKGPNGQFRFDPNTDKKVIFITRNIAVFLVESSPFWG